ncbi:MAG: mannose-1-phosphate guanylyltransferase [Candidatus Omnitrophica bacterium]|nr:mannose-1-phosphate guanylyltransferase [Candidatus Omnitrophota bacterium]
MDLKQKNFYIVILAGGSGTRFWPMSREDHPKQFLNIVGEQSLLYQTVARVSPPVSGDHIYIVTNAAHLKKIQQHTKGFGIPRKNILLEPSGKNTAPAVCWAAAVIQDRDPEAVMAVLPSDHVILNRVEFWKCLVQANDLARKGHLVTMGIVPTRPETGYGYLETRAVRQGKRKICRVEKFIEKPSLEKAKKFLKSKNYLWNSGMFVWKSSVILPEFKKNLPQIYKGLQVGHDQSYVQKIWKSFPSISIDYGILEKASDVVAVPAGKIGWSDVGSWEALYEILEKDREGNVHKGKVISLNCKNTMIHAQGRLVATVGLEDLIVIDIGDVLLVCRREFSQEVKQIVQQLKKSGTRKV